MFNFKQRVLDKASLHAIIKRRADSMGVSVTLDNTATTSSINPVTKRITIPFGGLPMPDDAAIKIKHAAIHESRHVLRPKNLRRMAELGGKEDSTYEDARRAFVLGAIEDQALEHEQANEYFGDKLDLGAGCAVLTGELAERMESLPPEAWQDEDVVKTAALSYIALRSRESWDTVGTLYNERVFNALSDDAKDLACLLDDQGFTDQISRAITEDEVYNVYENIYSYLYPEQEDSDNDSSDEGEPSDSEDGEEGGDSGSGSQASEDSDEASDSDGGGNSEADSDGDKEDDEGNDEEGTGERGTGDPSDNSDTQRGKEGRDGTDDAERSDGEGGESESQPKEERLKKDFERVPWQDFNFSDDKSVYNNPESEGMSIDWEGKEYDWRSSGNWTPANDELAEVDIISEASHYPSNYLSEDLQSRILGANVRQYLQTMTRSRILTERESGKIHNSNIARIAMPMIGDGSYNRKIFKTKQEGLKIDTCVTVLVDWSGSMSGQKKNLASQAAQILLGVFDKTLHIPTEVLTFSTSGRKFCNGVVKPFNEQSYTNEDIAGRFFKMDDYSGGNHDADAIVWAAGRLERRKERRKILIVLSDGSPSAASNGDPDSGLRMVIEDINNNSPIELYGIGICCSDVTEFYGERAQYISDVSELNSVLLETIKQGVAND